LSKTSKESTRSALGLSAINLGHPIRFKQRQVSDNIGCMSRQENRLENKVALITGAASGIGASAAQLFAANGATVFGVDKQDFAQPVDVSDEAQVLKAILKVKEAVGKIDILVNCAAATVRQSVHQHGAEDWDRIFAVNVKGSFLMAKHALPLMTGGSIIHVSSVVALSGMRYRAGYSASKGAIVALTRQMAMDYANRGVRVNAVCPGFVRTPFTAALTSDPEKERRLIKLHPLGRLGEPSDIAQAMLFLASDESSWMTGQCLTIDGGFTAGHADDV
jgi:meso-butanediol dehydrogenase / (S,S)-butanediol dehydrogenase / diacetyl reductase